MDRADAIMMAAGPFARFLAIGLARRLTVRQREIIGTIDAYERETQADHEDAARLWASL